MKITDPDMADLVDEDDLDELRDLLQRSVWLHRLLPAKLDLDDPVEVARVRGVLSKIDALRGELDALLEAA